MKVNAKDFIYKPVLALLLFIISATSQNICAQSIIYKSDGTTIKAYQLTKDGSTRSYQLSNDTMGLICYISSEGIDSIRYEDGSVERFLKNIILPENETSVIKARKNLLGVNVWPFFYKDIEFFYERLITEHIGIKNSVLIRLDENYPYGSYYEHVNFSVNSGVNYYFLESDLFRFGTGVAYNLGQFETEYWEEDEEYEYDPYSDYYYHGYTISYEKKTYGTVFINGSFTIKFRDIIFSTIQLDIPLFNYPPYKLLFKTEIAINF